MSACRPHPAPQRLAALAVAVLALPATVGCHATMVHLERNAPGHVDLNAPVNVGLPPGTVERPGDPGERMLSIGLGPWGAVGAARDAAGEGHALARWGAELTVAYERTDTSHWKDFLVMPVLGPSLSVGTAFYDSLHEDWRVGPAYLEGAYTLAPATRLALGVIWDHDADTVGPQMTLSFLGVYLRGAVLLGGDGDPAAFLEVGLAIEPPVTFNWSR